MTGGAQTTANRAVTPGNSGRKGGALSAPFYARPLEYLRGNITGIADGIRSLPDAQLQSELDQLIQACAGGQHPTAEASMALIYENEVARRNNPELQFDTDLNLALGRLERQTNPEDRAFVKDVGRKLFAIGGRGALDRAYGRMMGLARPTKLGVRETVLSKRWAGIDVPCVRKKMSTAVDKNRMSSGGKRQTEMSDSVRQNVANGDKAELGTGSVSSMNAGWVGR